MYLLIRFNKNKSFLWNTNNTDRNGANEQNAHNIHREKYNFWKSWLVLVMHLFTEHPPLHFTNQPLSFYGKILSSNFW